MDVTFPYVVGSNTAIPSSDDFSKNLYAPWTINESAAVLCGGLDHVNLGFYTVPRTRVLPGTFVQSKQVGSTHSVDYFSELFERYSSTEDVDNDDPQGMTPIVGAQQTFHLPRAATAVLFSWGISWATNIQNTSYRARLRLRIDGDWVASQQRESKCAMMERTYDAITRPYFSANTVRYWHGQYLSESVAKGWHTAGLWLGSDAGQTRIRVRSFRYIALF